jgi:anti-sigma factor RsiW
MPDFFNRLFGRGRRNGGGPPGGITCQELVELVTDYVEGALSDADRGRFEAHIAACGNCTTYVEQMRRTVTLAGQVTTESLSPEAERELLAAFRNWKAGTN